MGSIAGWRAAHGFLLRLYALVRDRALFRATGTRAVLAAHFFDGLGFSDRLAIADFLELLAEFAAGEVAVHFARAVHLALDADACRLVFEENAARGFVDFLSACAGTAHEFFNEVGLVDSEGTHPLGQVRQFFR